MAGTLIADIVAPHWQTLTPDQQIAWGFWGNEHPVTRQRGEAYALYSFQAFASVNSILAVLGDSYIIDNPPSSTTLPQRQTINFMALPHRARVDATDTLNPGWAFAYLPSPVPTATAVIFQQLRAAPTKSTGRQQSGNHITYALPDESGFINLQVPRGYFATTAGATRQANIKGGSALRQQYKPALSVIIVNLTNGRTLHQALVNAHPPRR